MTGGFMMSAGRLSLLAAAGFLLAGGASAQAADLGGNCCADLEERIAELEATTARKGNRKVKLEVSGQVNEAVIFWDDSVEDNVGVYTNDASRTRFRFKGDAKIADDWKAGYLLEVGVRGANSKRFNQDNPVGVTGSDTGFDLRHSTWYIDSKKLGRVWMGLTGGAGEGITEINVAGTDVVAKYSDAEDLGGDLALRRPDGLYSNGTDNVVAPAGQISIRRLIRAGTGNQPGEGRRYNMVRYDTPELFGFVGTANWGADDTWEVGVRYKGEFAGLKVAAGIAYGEANEATNATGQTGHVVGFECATGSAIEDAKCNQLGGSISVMHEATGLYVNLGAGYLEDERIRELVQGNLGAATSVDDRSEFWAIEAGLQQKWIPLGKTTVFGQYYHNDGGSFWSSSAIIDVGGAAGNARRIQSSELDIYSLGVMQGLDSAAMNIYAIYRHVEAEATNYGGETVQFEDVDMFMTGAIIKF